MKATEGMRLSDQEVRTAKSIVLLGRSDSIHMAKWANGLEARGFKVTVISSHKNIGLLDRSVSYFKLPVRAPWGYFLNAFYLRRLLRKLSPQILHVHFASGYGSLATLSGFHPRVVSVWGSDVYEFPDKSPLHQALLRVSLNSADQIYSTSETMAERVATFTEESIVVIPFGVDVELFHPIGEKTNYKKNKFKIGTARTLTEKYGVDILIRAFAILQEDDDLDLHLMIAGDGPEAAALRRLVIGLDISQRVDFLGHVEHKKMPEFMNNLDIFVVPSRYHSESFGVAVLEASACRLPVVVSNVGGLPEVVEDGVTGLIFQSESPFDLADCIRQLVRDQELRLSLGRQGRNRVAAHYSWSQSLDRMEAEYRAL